MQSLITNTILPVGMLVFGPLADLVTVEFLLVLASALMGIPGLWIFFKGQPGGRIVSADYEMQQGIEQRNDTPLACRGEILAGRSCLPGSKPSQRSAKGGDCAAAFIRTDRSQCHVLVIFSERGALALWKYSQRQLDR